MTHLTKQPSLKLKNLSRKLLGYVPLAFVLPAPAIAEKTLSSLLLYGEQNDTHSSYCHLQPRGGGIIV
jgi:hypothetical protein